MDSVNTTTESFIQAAFAVSNSLGCGFLEKVYENALAIELRQLGLLVERQKPIQVYYRERVVGGYVADLIIADTVLVELKALPHLDRIHTAQCLNYLAATRLPICLLLNFGQPRVEVKRILRKQQ